MVHGDIGIIFPSFLLGTSELGHPEYPTTTKFQILGIPQPSGISRPSNVDVLGFRAYSLRVQTTNKSLQTPKGTT